MDFPTKFTMKIVGAAKDDLEPIIIVALRNNKIDVERVSIAHRDSSAGKYTAFTAVFYAESQEQLDNIYRELSGNPQVIMAL